MRDDSADAVIASEAKQSTAPLAETWIASSLSLLAMTVKIWPDSPTGKSNARRAGRLSSPCSKNIPLLSSGKSLI
jgi:hypothetical protein